MTRCVAVIGAGSWGTAVSRHLASQGCEVRLWSHNSSVAQEINDDHENARYLPGCKISPLVVASCDIEWCLEGAESVLFVVPSTHLRSVAHQAAGYIGSDVPVCVLTKGIEFGSSLLMTEVVTEELGGPDRVACLSGPNHAEEVARDLPCGAVVASTDSDCAEYFRQLFNSERFRTYVSDDVVGVEVCAAFKNVVAIACGIVKGFEYGDNTMAVIMTRGLAEMSRLVASRGGNLLTCMGLAGMGDLVATCTSHHSRNQTFGIALSRGETLAEYERRTHMVVEGARACRSVQHMAKKHAVETPLADAVNALIYEGLSVAEISDNLSRRTANVEFYGLENSVLLRTEG